MCLKRLLSLRLRPDAVQTMQPLNCNLDVWRSTLVDSSPRICLQYRGSSIDVSADLIEACFVSTLKNDRCAPWLSLSPCVARNAFATRWCLPCSAFIDWAPGKRCTAESHERRLRYASRAACSQESWQPLRRTAGHGLGPAGREPIHCSSRRDNACGADRLWTSASSSSVRPFMAHKC